MESMSAGNVDLATLGINWIHTLHVSLPLVNDECVSTMWLSLLFLFRLSLTSTPFVCIGHDSYLRLGNQHKLVSLL